jgi:hypothetical protein
VFAKRVFKICFTPIGVPEALPFGTVVLRFFVLLFSSGCFSQIREP